MGLESSNQTTKYLRNQSRTKGEVVNRKLAEVPCWSSQGGSPVFGSLVILAVVC